jgi:cation diffusion facilitator family transporter
MSKARRLGLVLLLNLLLVAALVVVGVAAHSLGVLAAGVDYLADAAAIGVSLLAIWLTRRTVRRRPQRWVDPTHIAALINTGWLLALNVGVVVAAIRRLVSGAPEVHGLPVLIVSTVAAVVMFIGAIIVGGDLDNDDGAEDLNVKAVLLDTAADAAAAGGVAVTGAVILVTGGWFWLDPAVALALAVVIGYHAVVLIWRVLATGRTQATSQTAGGQDGGHNNGELRAAHLCHNQRRNRKTKPVVRHGRQW